MAFTALLPPSLPIPQYSLCALAWWNNVLRTAAYGNSSGQLIFNLWRRKGNSEAAADETKHAADLGTHKHC
jgi:hypothetical protein